MKRLLPLTLAGLLAGCAATTPPTVVLPLPLQLGAKRLKSSPPPLPAPKAAHPVSFTSWVVTNHTPHALFALQTGIEAVDVKLTNGALSMTWIGLTVGHSYRIDSSADLRLWRTNAPAIKFPGGTGIGVSYWDLQPKGWFRAVDVGTK